jgi:hypothetical protein
MRQKPSQKRLPLVYKHPPSVLDLLDLQLGELLRVVSEAQGVELAARVQGVLHLPEGTAVHPVALDSAQENDLRGWNSTG